MDEPIDDGFTDDRIFKQLKPTLGLDLRSDNGVGIGLELNSELFPPPIDCACELRTCQ
jgi:hypothetical protein